MQMLTTRFHPATHKPRHVQVRAADSVARPQQLSVSIGDRLPDAQFSYFDKQGNMQKVTTEEAFGGKKVVLFAVPGAFLPTCSMKHLPGYINLSDEMREKGVDVIACVSVNDAFVMEAWGNSVGTDGKIMLLADGSAKFTQAMGVDLNLIEQGVGIRSRRYSLVAEDRLITELHLEDGGAFVVSGAEDIITSL